MKLRHPHIACLIGHFQTGASWVQVSDWFEGARLEESWSVITESAALDRLGILLKLLQALQFCHEKGVFHRNVSADTVWVLADLSDLRLVGFDCALDVGGTSTANTAVLANRDSRLIPPEDLQAGLTTNARLADIFQVGVLLYRILENGAWPFENTLDYVTSGGSIRAFAQESDDPETHLLREFSLRMMDMRPERRPDLLSRVEQELRAAAATAN
jgi:serine/threonine protein kinase